MVYLKQERIINLIKIIVIDINELYSICFIHFAFPTIINYYGNLEENKC